MGIFFAFLASILYGTEPTLVDLALNSGLSAIDVQLLATSITAILALIICLITKTSLKISKGQLLPLIICGLTFYNTSLLQSISYLHIPVGFSTTIHFTYPTLVLLICVFIFKEKIKPLTIISTIVALTGLALISETISKFKFIGVIIAFLSAICYSVYLLVSEKSSIGDFPSAAFTFYVNIFGFMFALGSYSLSNEVLFDKSALIIKESGYLLTISIMLFIASYSLNKGIKLLGANKASSLTVIEPVTSLIVSTLVFHYQISLQVIIGCSLVLLSVYLTSIKDE